MTVMQFMKATDVDLTRCDTGARPADREGFRPGGAQNPEGKICLVPLGGRLVRASALNVLNCALPPEFGSRASPPHKTRSSSPWKDPRVFAIGGFLGGQSLYVATIVSVHIARRPILN